MKRLPIPATAKSSAVCSGVSMVSLSTNEPRESWDSGKSEDMITIRWLEKRRPYWARLEQLVQQSNSGIAALSHNELKELGLLYRQIASDLAAVREDVGGRQLTVYLNQLLGRTHNLIYMGHKPKISALVHFYRDTSPRVFRETLPQTLLAVAVVLVAAIAAWVLLFG